MNYLNIKQLPFYLAFSILIFSACNKAKVSSEEPPILDSEIQSVKAGNEYLIFENRKSFDKHLEKLLGSDAYARIWNERMNFVSAADLYDPAFRELENVTELEDAVNILNKYKNFISFNKDSTLELVNIPKILSKIVNKDGIVKIGKDLYKFTKEKQYILLDDDNPTPLLARTFKIR